MCHIINAAAAKKFQIAVEASIQYGSGYIPPTPYKLGEPFLKEAVKLTSTSRGSMRKPGIIMDVL